MNYSKVLLMSNIKLIISKIEININYCLNKIMKVIMKNQTRLIRIFSVKKLNNKEYHHKKKTK